MRVGTGAVGLGVMVLVVVAGCGGGGGEREAGASARLPTAELQGRWWSWAAAEPPDANPVVDGDGRDCWRNQPSDVWFLAGTFGGHAERVCTVPGGRPIAFPVVNTFGSPIYCANFISSAAGRAYLDGEEIEPEVLHPEKITVRGRAGNPVVDPGVSSSTGCGLWVQLPPLSPGAHTLEIQGQARDLEVSVTYSLTVKAQRGDETV
ncbi:signal protein [Streptomyces jumonjinensis]|uniref:signal protein n=2 Tax=Streptomyces jumonjinensis TaxID=1945 RepID=UPI003330438C